MTPDGFGFGFKAWLGVQAAKIAWTLGIVGVIVLVLLVIVGVAQIQDSYRKWRTRK